MNRKLSRRGTLTGATDSNPCEYRILAIALEWKILEKRGQHWGVLGPLNPSLLGNHLLEPVSQLGSFPGVLFQVRGLDTHTCP